MLEEALLAVEKYRDVLNSGNAHEVNKWISDDFIGYFGYYADRDYEIYRGEAYKFGNVETIGAYKDKNAKWVYQDLTRNMRTENELILSAIVDFYFSDQKVASALAMEVFKCEEGSWKLFRQHMERYAEV
ncbi:DUF4440 domain-containing protein [Robertmurraya yapensis]|uniref:DUF4440 domain-containing protein n=1 Tax=Bacillus yapensis TaxID=2492960 RepID=A0A3S0J059_9BACI|nr:DUF4440 domain-containing protein [Bacillus yapensis]RTR35162.1 DUF4440 domain-containing protein [Bacillus yapensis]TKS97671.1 DUF4440 domain-containing protein [Bacillus yapensis]